MAYQRRRIITPDTQWDHIFPPMVTTTNNTPTTMYTSDPLGVGKVSMTTINLRVYSAGLGAAIQYVVGAINPGTIAGIKWPPIATSQSTTVAGETISFSLNTGAATWSMIVTGKAATTYLWWAEVSAAVSL